MIRRNPNKVVEINVNGRPVIHGRPYITFHQLVEAVLGPQAAQRRHQPAIDYYGKIIGGGKLFKNESIHVEKNMRFTIIENP